MEGKEISPWMWEESQQPEEWSEDGAKSAASKGEEPHRRAASHGDEGSDGCGRAASHGEAELGVASFSDKEGDRSDLHQRAAEATKGARREHERDSEVVGGVGKQLDHDGKQLDHDLSDPRLVGGQYLRRMCAQEQGGSKCGDCGEWHGFVCPSCSQSLSGFACSLCGHGGGGVCRTCGKRPSAIDANNDVHGALDMDTDSGKNGDDKADYLDTLYVVRA